MKKILSISFFLCAITLFAQENPLEDFEKSFEAERDSLQELMVLAADDEAELNRLVELYTEKEEVFQKQHTEKTAQIIAAENQKIKQALDELEANTKAIVDSIVKANEIELVAAFEVEDEMVEVVETKSANLLKFESYLSKGKDYLYIYKRFKKDELIAIAKELEIISTGYKKEIALAIQNKLK